MSIEYFKMVKTKAINFKYFCLNKYVKKLIKLCIARVLSNRNYLVIYYKRSDTFILLVRVF